MRGWISLISLALVVAPVTAGQAQAPMKPPEATDPDEPGVRISTSRGPVAVNLNNTDRELSSEDLAVGSALTLGAGSQSDPWPLWPNPEATDALIHLARSLGEAHYLRLVCRDRDAQELRLNMQALLDQEAKYNQPLRQSLVAAFNDGYTVREGTLGACDDRNRALELKLMKDVAEAARLVTAQARSHLKAVTQQAAGNRAYIVEETRPLRGGGTATFPEATDPAPDLQLR